MSSLSEQRTPESVVGNTTPIPLKAKRWVEVVASPTPTPLPGEGNQTAGRAISTHRKRRILLKRAEGICNLLPTQRISRLIAS